MKRWMKKTTTWLLIVAMFVALLPAVSLSIFADTEIPHTLKAASSYPAETQKYAEYQLGTRAGSTLFTDLEDAANAYSYINYFTDDDTKLTFSKAMQGHNFIPNQNWNSDPAKRTNRFYFKNEAFKGYAPQVSQNKFDCNNVTFDYTYDHPATVDGKTAHYFKYGNTTVNFSAISSGMVESVISNNPTENSGGFYRVTTSDTVSCLYTNVGFVYRDGESVPIAMMMDFTPTAITNNALNTSNCGFCSPAIFSVCYTESCYVDVYDIKVTFLNQNKIADDLQNLAQSGSGISYGDLMTDQPGQSKKIEVNGTSIFYDIDAMQGFEFKDGFDSLNFHRNANGDSDVDRIVRAQYPDYDYQFLHYTATGTENSLGYVHGTGDIAYNSDTAINRALYTSMIATFSGTSVKYTVTMFIMNGRVSNANDNIDRYALPYFDFFDIVYNSGNTSANGGRAPYYTDFQSAIQNRPDGADMTTIKAYTDPSNGNYDNKTAFGGVGWSAMPWTPEPDISKKVSFAAPSASAMPGASELYDSLAMTDAEAETDSFYYYIDVDVPSIGSGAPYASLSVTDNLDNMVDRAADIMVFKRATDSNTWTDCTGEWTPTAGTPNGAYTPYTYTATNTASADFYYHVYRIVLKCSFNSSYLSDPSSVVANGIAETQLSTAPTRQAAHTTKTVPAVEAGKPEAANAAQTAEESREIKEIPETVETPEIVEISEAKAPQKKLEATDLAPAPTGESAQAIGNRPIEKAQANTKITYYPNGASATATTENHAPGSVQYLNSCSFTRTGYRFVGWATSGTATSITYGAQAKLTWPSEDTKLYAMWAKESECVGIRFYGTRSTTYVSGSTDHEYYTQYFKYGMNTPLRSIYFEAPSLYTFLGWHAYQYKSGKWLYTKDGTDKTGWYRPGEQPAGYFLYTYKDEAKVSAVAPAGQTVYMYAVWKYTNSSTYNRFQVTYDGNGGYGTMADEAKGEATGTTSHTFTLKNNAFVRPGWTFIGWTRLANTSSDKLWMHTSTSSSKGYEWHIPSGIPSGQYYCIVRDGITITPTTTNPRQDLYAQWATVYYPQFPNVVSSGTALKDISINGRVVANRPTGTAGILSGVTVTITNSSGTQVFSNSATIAANAASYNLPNLFSGNTTVLPDGTYTVKVSVKTKYTSPTSDNPAIQIYSHNFTVGNTYEAEPNSGETILFDNDPTQRNYNQDAAIKPAGTFMMFRANGDATNAGRSLTGTDAVLDTTPEYCFNQTFRFVLEGSGTIADPYYYEIINTETGAYLTDNGKGNAVTFTLPTRSTDNPAQQWHLYQKDGANNTYYLYSGLNNYLTASSAGSAITGDDEVGWVLRGVTMTVNEAVANYSIGGTNLSRESNAVNVRIAYPVTYEFDSTSAQVALPEELNDYLPDNVDYLFYGDTTDVTTDLTNGTKSVSVGDTVVDSNGLTWVYDVRDHTGGDTSAAYDNAAGKAEIATDGTGWKLTDGAADVSSAAADSTVTTTVKIADSTAKLTSYWTPYAHVFYEWDEDSPVPADADALIAAANNGESAIADTPLVQIGKPGNDINDAVTSSDGKYLFLGWYPSNDGSSVPTGKTISQITTGGTTTNVDSSVVVTEENFTMPAHNVYLEGLWVEMDWLAEGYYGVVDYILYDYSQNITFTPEKFDYETFSAIAPAGSDSVEMTKDTSFNDSTLLSDCSISATSSKATNGRVKLSLAPGATAKDTDVLKYTTDIGFLNNTYCGRTIEKTFPNGYTVYLIPASNVHYEEDFLTYDGAWTEEGTKAMDDQAGLHPIHGYDAAYAANTAENSADSAKKTTVSASDNSHKAEFTFTGNGFDIISRCSSDSGTMLVYVYNSENKMVETVICDCWLDTDNESTYYQIPVVHKTDYAYGTYRVEVYAYYNALFDHNSAKTKGVLTEAKIRQMLNIPEGTPVSIVKAAGTDLSDYTAQTAKRGNAASGSYSIYLDGIRIYNPLGYTNTENGPLNESSENYNAAAAYLYRENDELDPDYVQVRKVIVTGEDTGDSGEVDGNSALYVASKGSFGTDASYTSGAVYLSTSGSTLDYDTDTNTETTVGSSTFFPIKTTTDASAIYYNVNDSVVVTEAAADCYALYQKKIGEKEEVGETVNVYDKCLYYYDGNEMHAIKDNGKYLFIDNKVDVQGPENEMYLQSGTAIAFQVANYQPGDTVHISLKSPTGTAVSASVNGQAAANVCSKTEVYYNISDFVTNDGIVAITTDAVGSNVLSVCNIKVTGRTPASASARTASVRACSPEKAYNAILGIQTEPDEKPVAAEDFGITSAYLRLNQDINVIYTAKVPEGCEDATMTFTMNGVETTVTEYTVNDNGEYCFEFAGVTPQCMNDNISAVLYGTVDGKQYTDTHSEYSVRTYCVNTLARYADDAKTVTLLSDLLTYGAAAQSFTGYHTDALVTADLALAPSTFSEIGGYGAAFDGERASAADWTSAGLILSNNLAVRFAFQAESVENLTVAVSINGRTETYTAEDFEAAGNGEYSIEFRGISATEFADTVSASFLVNGEQVGRTVSYSVNAYICGTQNCENASLQALVRALYNYGAAASSYAK